MNNQLTELLNKSMTRRQFLGFLGVAFLTVFGVSSFLKSLSEINVGQNRTSAKTAGVSTSNSSSSYGFGSGPYGV